jgi:hypothetical protein
VVVINPTQETIVTNVISRPTSAIVEFNAIVKICKSKWFHEGHHFISMTMGVHDTRKCDMDHFIKECVCLFHDRQSKVICPCLIQFFK